MGACHAPPGSPGAIPIQRFAESSRATARSTLGSAYSLSFSRRFLAYGLALGAIIRLFTLAWPGTVDVEVWKVWSFAASHNATGAYGVGGAPPERRLLRLATGRNGRRLPTDRVVRDGSGRSRL